MPAYRSGLGPLWLRPCRAAGICHCPSHLSEALANKYAQLLVWRLSHEALSRDASAMQRADARRRRQGALAKLAALYPGALRELLRLNAAALQWRYNQATRSGPCAPVWLSVVWHHHALWHRALAFRHFYRSQSGRASRHAPSGGALVKPFNCWYERDAGQTPWVGQWPLALRLLSELTQQPRPLRGRIETLLKQHFGLDDALLSLALWGELRYR